MKHISDVPCTKLDDEVGVAADPAPEKLPKAPDASSGGQGAGALSGILKQLCEERGLTTRPCSTLL
jgi:hypothetical protein